jgi:subtilisin family serine protease
LKVQLQPGAKKPKYFDEYAQAILTKTAQMSKGGGNRDTLWLPFPPGTYLIQGFGPTANVKRGEFDVYAPFAPSLYEAAFIYGAEKKKMIGSPGNAANVITVGSYDFRRDWNNQNGERTSYNLPVNGISDYSSPGGLRADGVFKPDITAPARYTISSLSEAARPGPSCKCVDNEHECANMGAEAGPSSITADGMHIAWSGTSAAAPYTAGVIALMLQKNPRLDAKQIKDILARSAIKNDRYVGAVPNPEWGYGKINPAGAIAATPPAGAGPRRRTRG